jgi:cytochrome c oxidase assembly protein subunit 11
LSTDPSRRRNVRVAVLCLVTFLGMVGAAYAAVPLYKAFCQATGFDGTVRRASGAPDKILDRQVVIRFDTNIRNLPWEFSAEQVSQSTRIGATQLAFFKVRNTSDHPVTGRAVYNVLPESAGPYFQKLECFCFTDQTLAPGQSMEFPVVYFVDPRFVDDKEVNGAKEITLSYTFYPSKGKTGS